MSASPEPAPDPNAPQRSLGQNPAIPPEILQEIAQKVFPQIQTATGVQVAIGPPPNAFIEKLQPEHITSIIGHTAKDKERQSYIFLATIVIGIVGFLAICWLFLAFQKDAMLEGVLKVFAGFLGGFGSGFAAARWKGKH
jgi:hypothetical protein